MRFSAIRNRMTYANVVATLALVFAMTGGAYAAGRYLITSTKQINPKVLKQLHGQAGAAGKEGAAGAPGKEGTTGKEGAAGKEGTAGSDGASGTSATTESFTGKAHGCEEGGVIVKSASPEAVVCDGKAGKNGTTGFTETLPPGKTETGAWAFGPYNESALPGGSAANIDVPISFAIPLASSLTIRQGGCTAVGGVMPEECRVHYINAQDKEVARGEEFELLELAPTQCPGSAAEPQATRGNLCVYARAEGFIKGTGSNDIFSFANSVGASTAGAILVVHVKGEGAGVEPEGYGSWAVTAE